MRYLALLTCLLFVPTLADANALTINLGNIATPGEIPLPVLDNTPLDGSLLSLTITWTAANIVSSYGYLDADLILYPVASGPSSITTGGGTGYFLDGANHQITPTITMIHNGGAGSIIYDLIYTPFPFDNPPAASIRGVHWDFTLPQTITGSVTADHITLMTSSHVGVLATPEPSSFSMLLLALAVAFIIKKMVARAQRDWRGPLGAYFSNLGRTCFSVTN